MYVLHDARFCFAQHHTSLTTHAMKYLAHCLCVKALTFKRKLIGHKALGIEWSQPKGNKFIRLQYSMTN